MVLWMYNWQTLSYSQKWITVSGLWCCDHITNSNQSMITILYIKAFNTLVSPRYKLLLRWGFHLQRPNISSNFDQRVNFSNQNIPFSHNILTSCYHFLKLSKPCIRKTNSKMLLQSVEVIHSPRFLSKVNFKKQVL